MNLINSWHNKLQNNTIDIQNELFYLSRIYAVLRGNCINASE